MQMVMDLVHTDGDGLGACDKGRCELGKEVDNRLGGAHGCQPLNKDKLERPGGSPSRQLRGWRRPDNSIRLPSTALHPPPSTSTHKLCAEHPPEEHLDLHLEFRRF